MRNGASSNGARQGSTDKQRKAIMAIASKLGMSAEDVRRIAGKRLHDLTKEEASNLISMMDRWQKNEGERSRITEAIAASKPAKPAGQEEASKPASKQEASKQEASKQESVIFQIPAGSSLTIAITASKEGIQITMTLKTQEEQEPNKQEEPIPEGFENF